MSLFKNIFKKSEADKNEVTFTVKWNLLTTVEQLDEIMEESKNSVVGIFKHSTRCVISRTVLKQFEQSVTEDLPIKMYYLDLLNYRELSNEIAEKFQVIHQSPQLLLLKDRETIAHASHYDIISQIDLQQFAK